MVVASGYGGPEVLELHDIVLPQPGAGQVLIDVKAAGANAIDYKLYSGCLLYTLDVYKRQDLPAVLF